jgi:hypothetical protein
MYNGLSRGQLRPARDEGERSETMISIHQEENWGGTEVYPRYHVQTDDPALARRATSMSPATVYLGSYEKAIRIFERHAGRPLSARELQRISLPPGRGGNIVEA